MLAERLKNVLPSLISSDQTAYVKGRFISKGGRLISDVLEICDKLQIKGFLMTVDNEKAFNSTNYCFLIKVLDMVLKKILSSGLKYYYKIKNHAS